MNLQPMYPASPTLVMQLTADITASDQEIPVGDGTAFPPGPNFATLGTDNNAEVILYGGVDSGGNKLTGCARGQSGTVARAFRMGAFVYHSWTSQEANAIMGNIQALNAEKLEEEALTAHNTAPDAHNDIREGLAAKADTATTYTKTQADELLAGKADTATTYTKTQTDALLVNKADTAHLLSATLTAAAWTQPHTSVSVWQQTIPDVTLSPNSQVVVTADDATVLSLMGAGISLRVDNMDGVAVAKALGAVPSNDLTVQLMVLAGVSE